MTIGNFTSFIVKIKREIQLLYLSDEFNIKVYSYFISICSFICVSGYFCRHLTVSL